MKNYIDFFADMGVIPVIAIDHAEHAVRLGEFLLAGGLNCIEITFRTAAAEEAIQRISKNLPQLKLGAGTITSHDQVEKAISAGAQFIVSPGFDTAVVDYCVINEVPVFPGVATPTEIMMALNKGLHLLKFFPAEALGGSKMLKALAAPFPGVMFIPTGGINIKNLANYLELPMVHACGGSWLANRQLIAAEKFDEITSLATEARKIVDQVQKQGSQQ